MASNAKLYKHVMAQIFFSKNRKSIVDLLANGVPAGLNVVSDTWDSPIISPAFKCLDTELTGNEVIDVIRQEMTSLSSLGSVNSYFSVEVSALPESLQESLTTSGRCTVTDSQLLSCIKWTSGCNEDSLPQKDVD